MKILVVCGHGLGSSFMVEMNAQEALSNLMHHLISKLNIVTL